MDGIYLRFVQEKLDCLMTVQGSFCSTVNYFYKDRIFFLINLLKISSLTCV